MTSFLVDGLSENSVFDNHQNEAPSQRQGLKSVLLPKKAELSCSAAKCCCQARRFSSHSSENNNHNNSGKERERESLSYLCGPLSLNGSCVVVPAAQTSMKQLCPRGVVLGKMHCGDFLNSRNHHLQNVKRFHSQAAFRRSKPCV